MFHSLQGESDTVGVPTVFIRLTGCPLRCGYCDTRYAFYGGKARSVATLLRAVRRWRTRYVTVTGGEPLAQPACLGLLRALNDAGYRVSLETSGALDLEGVDRRTVIVMDLKTPGSGEHAKNRLANLDLLSARDQVKFVLCSRQDYEWARAMIERHQLHRRVGEVLLSPSYGQLPARHIAEWMLADQLPARLQVQLHKLLWGRGARTLTPDRQGAVTLLSGGLDSATALAMALSEGYRCHALSVDYGQRHGAELAAARRIARSMPVAAHRIVAAPLDAFGQSALTDARIAVPNAPTDGVPPTYVPARNTVLLALALACAESLSARHIFIGVNAVDYAGYPDCRPQFIQAFQALANVATKQATEDGAAITVHAPLIGWSKPRIIRRGLALGVDYGLTVSCYRARPERPACGRCDSCRLRREGFRRAGAVDPLPYPDDAN